MSQSESFEVIIEGEIDEDFILSLNNDFYNKLNKKLGDKLVVGDYVYINNSENTRTTIVRLLTHEDPSNFIDGLTGLELKISSATTEEDYSVSKITLETRGVEEMDVELERKIIHDLNDGEDNMEKYGVKKTPPDIQESIDLSVDKNIKRKQHVTLKKEKDHRQPIGLHLTSKTIERFKSAFRGVIGVGDPVLVKNHLGDESEQLIFRSTKEYDWLNSNSADVILPIKVLCSLTEEKQKLFDLEVKRLIEEKDGKK